MYPNKHVFPGWSQVLSVVFFSHCLSRLFRWPLGCQCSTAPQHMMGPKQPRSIWWVCVSFCVQHHIFQTWRRVTRWYAFYVYESVELPRNEDVLCLAQQAMVSCETAPQKSPMQALTRHTGLSHKKPSEECFETVVLKRVCYIILSQQCLRIFWKAYNSALLTRVSYRSLLHKCEVSCSFLDRSVPSTMSYRSVSKNAPPECLAACTSVLDVSRKSVSYPTIRFHMSSSKKCLERVSSRRSPGAFLRMPHTSAFEGTECPMKVCQCSHNLPLGSFWGFTPSSECACGFFRSVFSFLAGCGFDFCLHTISSLGPKRCPYNITQVIVTHCSWMCMRADPGWVKPRKNPLAKKSAGHVWAFGWLVGLLQR